MFLKIWHVLLLKAMTVTLFHINSNAAYTLLQGMTLMDYVHAAVF